MIKLRLERTQQKRIRLIDKSTNKIIWCNHKHKYNHDNRFLCAHCHRINENKCGVCGKPCYKFKCDKCTKEYRKYRKKVKIKNHTCANCLKPAIPGESRCERCKMIRNINENPLVLYEQSIERLMNDED